MSATGKFTTLRPHWVARLVATPVLYWIALLGLCAAYIQGGLVKAADFQGALAELQHFGVPPSSLLVLATIVTELVGSAFVLLNCYRWLGALWLAVFTLFATLIANRFWSVPPPDRFMAENSFFEHLGLIGGFLVVAWHDLNAVHNGDGRAKP